MRDVLERFGWVDVIGANRFYRTVGAAVKAYLHRENVQWPDWEDRPRGKCDLVSVLIGPSPRPPDRAGRVIIEARCSRRQTPAATQPD